MDAAEIVIHVVESHGKRVIFDLFLKMHLVNLVNLRLLILNVRLCRSAMPAVARTPPSTE
jgi:hypothetical protein